MPKEKTGKVIKKIRFNKKNIVVTFNDGEKIEISEDAYASSYLYVGKELEQKDIDKLNRITSIKKLMQYALSLLSKGHYTERKMREKLYAKEGDKESVDFVIERLKNIDLINDKAFIEDYKGYAEEKGWGKNKIKQELMKKGIFAEEIDKIRFSDALEKKKAIELIPSLEKKYQKYSYEQKKRHIYNALLAKGFDHDIASLALDKIKQKDNKDELAKLEADFKKVLMKCKRKWSNKELKEKVFQQMKNKGYRYADINKMFM